jgi:hypothetical protein
MEIGPPTPKFKRADLSVECVDDDQKLKARDDFEIKNPVSDMLNIERMEDTSEGSSFCSVSQLDFDDLTID